MSFLSACRSYLAWLADGGVTDGADGGMQIGSCGWGHVGGRCSWGRWEMQMEGCRWGGADGVDGGMQMGTDTDRPGGRMEIGQIWDADGAYGGIQMGTDAENPCPPLCRHEGEGGAAAWLSTLPPFAKQSQAVFQLRYFIFFHHSMPGV